MTLLSGSLKVARWKPPAETGSGESGGTWHQNPQMTSRYRVRAHAAMLVASISASLVLLPSAARAWGADGHRLVASVAEGQLSPAAKAEIARLLAVEPGATLATISTWADQVRNPATAAWHYVNFPRDGGCSYNAEQMCLGGNCVVSAIERQTAILASNAPDTERLLALKYVVHFVADVHQPLHAGYADDRGGNGYQLQAFDRGTNLHALWDSALIRNWPGGVPALEVAVAAEPVTADGTSQSWAEDSCKVVGDPGFYPAGRTLQPAYVDQWSAPLKQRLALASRRLAGVLNRSLAR